MNKYFSVDKLLPNQLRLYEDDIQDITLNQWLNSIFKNIQKNKKIAVFISINSNDKIKAQNIVNSVIKYYKIIFGYQQIILQFKKNFKLLTKKQQKIQIFKSINAIKLDHQKQSKLVQVSNTHPLLSYISHYLPHIDKKQQIKLLLKQVVIQQINSIQKKIVYNNLKQAKKVLNNCIPFYIQPFDILISTQQQIHEQQEVLNQLYPSPQLCMKLNYYKIELINKLTYQKYLKQKNKIIEFIQKIFLKKQLLNMLQIIKVISLVNKLKKYIFQIYKKHQIQKIHTYFQSFIIINDYKCKIQFLNLQKINSYLKTINIHRKYIKQFNNLYIKPINMYLKSFKQNLNLIDKKKTLKVLMVQKIIRSYLIKVKQYQQYQKKYNDIYLQKQFKFDRQYQQWKNMINLKLMELKYYQNSFIQCQLQIIQINSWALTDIFQPNIVGSFISNSLSISHILKIIINSNSLILVMANGKKLEYGLNPHPQSPKQTLNNKCQFIYSQDLSYAYLINESKQLYAKGTNSFGQLGLGNRKDVFEFKKVQVQKVKSLSTKLFHTICLTQDNSLFHWGAEKGKFKQSQTPILIKNIQKIQIKKSIKSVICSSKSIFLLMCDGQVYNLMTNQKYRNHPPKQFISKSSKSLNSSLYSSNSSKRSINQNSINYKKTFVPNEFLLINTGSFGLDITYLVKLKIKCYDTVKRNKILKWFMNNRIYQSNDESILIEQYSQNKENNIKFSNDQYKLNS